MSNDPIESNRKQESLDFIKSQIETMLKYAERGQVIDEVVFDINLRDIKIYMNILQGSQDLPFKLSLIRSSIINNEEKFMMLCDYTGINNIDMPLKEEQRVYFIESSDFAVTFIPMQLHSNQVNIFMEPLEDSPKFVRDMWEDLDKKKGLDDLQFVKFD